MTDRLEGISEFVAVVEAKGFRAAGRRPGVSGTALSKALRRLEERLGVILLQRTTRSVRLTEAGECFYAAARQAIDGLETATGAVGELADRPRETVRLNISSGAEGFLRGGPWKASCARTRMSSSTSSWTRKSGTSWRRATTPPCASVR
jgi:DNA-binding transcriptional LysR family regulator